jgi:hypothetical protein
MDVDKEQTSNVVFLTLSKEKTKAVLKPSTNCSIE